MIMKLNLRRQRKMLMQYLSRLPLNNTNPNENQDYTHIFAVKKLTSWSQTSYPQHNIHQKERHVEDLFLILHGHVCM